MGGVAATNKGRVSRLQNKQASMIFMLSFIDAPQSAGSLFNVRVRGSDARNHEGETVASQAVLQETREFGVAVRRCFLDAWFAG